MRDKVNVHSYGCMMHTMTTASMVPICILLALKYGLRDQELMHLEFTDIKLGGRHSEGPRETSLGVHSQGLGTTGRSSA